MPNQFTKAIPPEERFWKYVLCDLESHCWLWTGSINPDGYGQFWLNGRRTKSHHFLNGKAPAGLEWDHLCRVRNCVNPAHLEAVTRRINTLRGETQAALHAAKTHCPQGHPYDLLNTLLYQGRRYCRACRHLHHFAPLPCKVKRQAAAVSQGTTHYHQRNRSCCRPHKAVSVMAAVAPRQA